MFSDDLDTEMAGTQPLTDVAKDVDLVIADAPMADEGQRYEMMGVLGRGGMGEVKLAKDRRILRQVAVKLLGKQLQDKPDWRSRFLVEARVQGQLEHPSIVPVHDLGETADGELFFSMKRVRGMTLHKALLAVRRGEAGPKLSRRRLLTAFSSVCQAIEFAHTHGVVHRDLKPGNVMLGDYGEVYVLDWGIAKLVGSPETPPSVEIPPGGSAETHVGKLLGTPQYMAPERRTHGIANRQTDVYALGLILWEILTADPSVGVPPELQALVTRATHSDPQRRLATARELHDVLEKYLDGDRDLELRRTQAEEHARLAEAALVRSEPTARTEAGREIGRALGLDPQNKLALRVLMRLLTDEPAQMPPAAQAEIDRVWRNRRKRTLRATILIGWSALLYVPFMLAMGVASWSLFALWLVLTVAGGGALWLAAEREATLPALGAMAVTAIALSVFGASSSIMGVMPVAAAIFAMSWRMTMRRWFHGVIVVVLMTMAVLVPQLPGYLGWMTPMFTVRDDAIVILPHMNHFPAIATHVALLVGTIGALVGAVLFGRLYMTEIRRVEHRLTFQAWQLQQMLPEER